MKKLYEIFGQQPVKGDVGIEIEVEGKRLTDDVDPRWNAIVDGSLRGENREYVLHKPIPANTAKDALQCLKDSLDAAKSKLDFSFRTSVHIHINVQQLTYPQYLNFIYTYFLLEEPLMTFCGKERKGNRFCLRLQDAEGMLETYNNMFTGRERALFEVPANQVRYSAMNIEATPKFGSLEFRGMRGNLDVDLISTWIDCLIRIREFAKSVDNPTQVYDLYAENEAQGFMEKVIGDLTPRFYYPRMVKDVQRSFSLSLELPFTYGREQKRKTENVPELEIDEDLRDIYEGNPRYALLVQQARNEEKARIKRDAEAFAAVAAPRVLFGANPVMAFADLAVPPIAPRVRAAAPRAPRPVRREI